MGRTTDLAGILALEEFLEASVENTNKAVALAINDTLKGPGLKAYRRAIRAEVNFPAGYIEDSNRFGVDQRASPDNLVGSLIARQRPTSLARFATSGTIGGKGGVSVKVSNKGGGGFFKSGFLVRLKSGTALDGESYNVGLAVRLAPGQTLNKTDTSRMVHLEANVVLLYGPSIDQVLNNGVADATDPEVVEDISTEFFRQFARLSDG